MSVQWKAHDCTHADARARTCQKRQLSVLIPRHMLWSSYSDVGVGCRSHVLETPAVSALSTVDRL